MTSYLVLAVGAVVALCFYTLAGRLAGVGITALWSVATAYFFMAPVYSFRVSNSRDLAGLALFGVVGLVFARTPSPAKRRASTETGIRNTGPPPDVFVDLRSVLAGLTTSSELGERLKRRQIEVDISGLPNFGCSREDAARVLSDVLLDALVDHRLRRVSFYASRRPGVEVLFVDAHRVWPLPLDGFAITIGKRDEDCSRADFPGWPSHLTATWFDNGRSRIYQVSFPTVAAAVEGAARSE